MKNLLKKISAFTAVLAFALLAVLSPVPVSAQTTDEDCKTGSGGITGGLNCSNPDGPDGDIPGLFGSSSIFVNIVNALLFLIGAISVIMLIYGGIRYTASGGNANNVTAAKNTIMYAIIGLVVAFLAFAIVNWVLGGLGGSA